MVPKLSFPVALSAAVLGTVLSASLASASPCPFKSWSNPTDSVTSNDPSSLTDNQLSANKPDFNKLGILGASFAALFGLYAGSTVFKARFAKQQASDIAEVPLTEVPQPDAETYAELPTFPIVVPAEVLTSINNSIDKEGTESESTVAR